MTTSTIPAELPIQVKPTAARGQLIPDKRPPLVACDTHTINEIESAYKREQSTNGKVSDHKREED